MPVIIRHIIYTVLLTNIAVNLYGQDLPVSQFYNSLVLTNPAYAGLTNHIRMSAYYRQQWIKVPGAFESYGISYDRSIQKYNSGFGIIAGNTISGAVMQPSVDFIYSYQVQANRFLKVSMAIQAGVVQKYFRSSALIFEDNSESINSGFNRIYPDFAAGLVFFYKKNLFGGFSIHHLNRPQVSRGSEASRVTMKYTGHAGYVIELKSRLVKQSQFLVPVAMVQIHGNQQNMTWGTYYQYQKIIAGLLVRHNIYTNIDVLIFSAGFKTQTLRFAYSYDMNIGKRAVMPLGSHEISLTLLFKAKKNKKYKAIECPSFLE